MIIYVYRANGNEEKVKAEINNEVGVMPAITRSDNRVYYVGFESALTSTQKEKLDSYFSDLGYTQSMKSPPLTITSPNGKRWNVTVDDSGNITTEEV